MPKWLCYIVYPAVCAIHGFLFGILYAPAEALMFGLNFEQAIAWILSGVVFDVTHGISNIFMGLLIYPLSELLKKLSRQVGLN